VITLFNGFYTFPSKTKSFAYQDFVTAYAGIVIYVGLYLFWKVFEKTRWFQSAEADIITCKAAVDPERKARNVWERAWFLIA